MAKVIAVIGAGYGDEGKGLMTDYFSSQYDDAVVIRSNGGAQAGHTVVTPEGQRHVFSHFGSGTFNKVPTFLSKHFVVNPSLFMKEHKSFVEKFGFNPTVYVDPRCIITTPFDMLINQAFEKERGNDKHGSCGVGFGETLERALLGSMLEVDDIASPIYSKDWLIERLRIELESIREDYLPSRVNMDDVSEDFKYIITSTKLVSDFIAAVGYMLDNIATAYPEDFKNDTLIFEGAQGLLLDMDYGYFPHVTRSNCGMKNISQVLSEINCVHDITVNYVTRSYTTRHGAGPLAYEKTSNIGTCTIREGFDVEDNTNVPNEFQGNLRFAPLDLDLFKSITDKDFLNYAPRGSKKTVTVTHMDQVSDEMGLVYGGQLLQIEKETFKSFFETSFQHRANYVSYGEMRDDVRKIDKGE